MTCGASTDVWEGDAPAGPVASGVSPDGRKGEARGISADGRTIVGWGRNPDGFTDAWLARIPEPATLTLLLLVAPALRRPRRRR